MSSITAPLRLLAAAALCVSLIACGGGGDGGCPACGVLASMPTEPTTAPPASTDSPPSPGNPEAPAEPTIPSQPTSPTEPPAPGDPTSPIPSYLIGGTLSGLADSTKLVLLANGGDALTLAANGPFSFAAPIAFNSAYTVTVGAYPLWQNCSVINGSGTATADTSSVHVNCELAQAQVTTLAGKTTSGSTDGAGNAASFNQPQAIAVDGSGNAYVADSDNYEIRKITPDGIVTTLAGSTTWGWNDGTRARWHRRRGQQRQSLRGGRRNDPQSNT